MSRPLILVLQLVGLVMIINGWISDPHDFKTMGIGFIVALVGASGYRSRTKKKDD